MYNHTISMKYIMLINVKMPPNVGIQTFDQAFAVCIPVYEGFGLFPRKILLCCMRTIQTQISLILAQSHQRPHCSLFRKHMGLYKTKPAFGSYDKARPKQVQTSYGEQPEYRNLARSKLIYHRFYQPNNKGADQSVRMRRLV